MRMHQIGHTEMMGRQHHRPNRAAGPVDRTSIPAARILRQAGVDTPTWRNLDIRQRISDRYRRLADPLAPHARTFAVYFFGLFPLWAIVAMVVAFLWIAGLRSSP